LPRGEAGMSTDKGAALPRYSGGPFSRIYSQPSARGLQPPIGEAPAFGGSRGGLSFMVCDGRRIPLAI